MSDAEATQQVVKKMNYNPTGKGGFGDHPENRNPGGWDKNNTFSYWLNFFKQLSPAEFRSYPGQHPEMTMAAVGAYTRIENMFKIDEFREVANRTEGMPTQKTELSGPEGKKIIIKYTKGD